LDAYNKKTGLDLFFAGVHHAHIALSSAATHEKVSRMHNIIWPEGYPTYYSNASDIRYHDGSGPLLQAGARFRFTTFGFAVEAQVTELDAPADGKPGRVAWHGWVEGDATTRLDVHHAWLFEDLSGGRLRLLTQETQKGAPAAELANIRPNPMINGHQEWLDGLIGAARASNAV
jgi:hypothetical protein